MDYSNRDRINPRGRMDQPNRRKAALAFVLVAVAAVFLFRAWLEWHNVNDTKLATTDYVAFMAAAHQAESIADPLQRCLHYPSLPGTHWNDDTTVAYCQLSNYHTLALSEIDALLQQGKAAEVDRTFQSYLDTQLHDPKQPGMLDKAFYNAGFDNANTHTRAVIDSWKQQSPDSAFAFAASGMQYVDAAQQARGTGWGRDLNEDQTKGMNQQLILARQDLDHATTLQPAMPPVYTSMISAGGFAGDDDYMNQAAARGLAVDPANFAMRMQMVDKAQPKWGSEFGGEGEQQREAKAQVSRNPLLRMIVGRTAVNRATCDCERTSNLIGQLMQAADGNLSYGSLNDLAREAYNHNDPRLAVELYSEALRFNPDDAEMLQWRALQIAKLGDSSGAIESVAQAARRFPDDNAIGTQFALAYVRAGKVKEAESTFLAVLKRDPDDQIAMANLGDLYNHAAHQPDKAEAIADTLIRRHPDFAGGYIVRACNQMDHNLPGRYDTIHYFIDHFGDLDEFKSQAAEMRAYLIKHPEKLTTG
ncbi:MAG: tetratricopeptide repeat protein [Rhodanobacter sp.]